jgi:N-acetylglutamate synthase-like GNAT family acetyltransferase
MVLANLTIRQASIADLPALERVGDQLFDHPIKPERAKEFFNCPRHHLVLACLKDKVIGMASAFIYIHPDKNPALFMNEVGDLEAFQNHGVGRSLVKYLNDFARESGCEEVWVATEQSNVAARKAYVAAGGVEDDEPVVLITFNTKHVPTQTDDAFDSPME